MTVVHEAVSEYSQFVSTLKSRHKELSASYEQILGMQHELFKQKAEYIVDMEQSMSYLDQKDEVRRVLTMLHERSVESVKALYEDLLTGLLRDIFPDDPENDRVQLNLQVKRNQSSLSIDVINREGFARDVFLDKGGSVKSIIAIGLRFIALARSPRRRIVVLDEADRALNARDIPRFAKMMAQLSSRIGMQVIYVSHHDHKLFEGNARIIRLSRENQKVYADCISDTASKEIVGWEGEEDIGEWMENVGLTDIRLVNVKQHANTLVELSPLVNVIVGKIDVGKSTIVQAMEVVARNNPREKMIRDHERQMRVEIGLEANQRLIFSYKRSGARKTSYRLYDSNNVLTRESKDGNKTPDWLHTYLGMELYRGFDVHIGMQGSVDFLLDPRYSDFKRAEILSLSKVSGGSQRMISLHQKKVDQNQKKYTETRKKLSLVKVRLSSIDLAKEASDVIEDCQKTFEQIENLGRDVQSINEDIISFQRDRAELSVLSKIANISLPGDEVNQLISDKNIDSLVADIKLLEDLEKERDCLSKIKNCSIDDLPIFDDSIFDIFEEGKAFASLLNEEKILSNIKDVILPVVPDDSSISEVSELYRSLSEFEEMSKSRLNLNNDLKQSQRLLKTLENDLKEELKKMGPICTTCQQPINIDHGDHKHE